MQGALHRVPFSSPASLTSGGRSFVTHILPCMYKLITRLTNITNLLLDREEGLSGCGADGRLLLVPVVCGRARSGDVSVAQRHEWPAATVAWVRLKPKGAT
jgi:hypothetical protein